MKHLVWKINMKLNCKNLPDHLNGREGNYSILPSSFLSLRLRITVQILSSDSQNCHLSRFIMVSNGTILCIPTR